MAKKVKKASSKVTKEDLVAQNEALGEQVAGLQEEVMDLVEENDNAVAAVEELYDYVDQLEDRNDALQSSLVDKENIIEQLEEELDAQENLLQLADLVVDESDEYEALTEAEIAELKQDNYHLTIQLAAAKDRRLRIEAELFTLRLEHSAYRIRAFSGETYNSTTGKYSI